MNRHPFTQPATPASITSPSLGVAAIAVLRLAPCIVVAGLLAAPQCRAEVRVDAAQSASATNFKLGSIARPATNDAATAATFTLVDGQRNGNTADLTALHDGRLPGAMDEPSKNFSFQDGTNGGRIKVDLGKRIAIKSINSYSWHPRARAAQVYKLYAAKGDEAGFQDSPKRDIEPASCGWTPIAKVDTRSKGLGGQHAASIADSTGAALGEFRYLLFDVKTPDAQNPQANTFFSEIDVVEANGPVPVEVPEQVWSAYASADGKFKFAVDTTLAPDLAAWVDKELMPTVCEWYPRLVALLPSDHFAAATKVQLEFRTDMGGTPAYTGGTKVSMNLPWFRTQLQGEAKGCVIHELVHVVQHYGGAAAGNAHPTQAPGWVCEGIADYVRWFVYEPKSKGAEISKGSFPRVHHNDSYRTTANFLNWASETHDKDLVRKLNAAAREGSYSEKVWQDATGKTTEQLAVEWKAALAKRLGL